MEDKLIQLFLQIINMSITASYVIIAVLLIRLLLKKAPKKYSYALWSVVAFRLCCPVSFESVFSLFSLKLFDMSKAQSESGATLQYVPRNIGMMAQPEVTVGIPYANSMISGSLPEATPMYSANPMQIWTAIGMYLWCLGMAVLVIYSVISYLSLHYRMRKAILLEGIIYQSETVRSPFMLGIIRPKIYIPFGLDEQTLEYVLTHERYHLKRRDHITKPFAFLLLTIHWFNPLCWLAFTLMSRDMEMSCDEKVLSGADNIRKAYSTTLLSFATNRRFPAPSPLAFGETGVKKRIRNVLSWKKPALWITVFAIVLCGAVLLACAANPVTDKSDSPVSEDVEQFPFGNGNLNQNNRGEDSEAAVWAGTTYCVGTIVFDAPLYDFSYTLSGTPTYYLAQDEKLNKKLFVQGDALTGSIGDSWYELGICKEFALTEENFDACFRVNKDSELGWHEETRTSKLREDNEKAWQLFLNTENVEYGYYILQQKNGDIYIAYGYYNTENAGTADVDKLESIRWLFRLREADMFTTYVSTACLYMTPFSSYLPVNGDSGYYYLVNENSFYIATKSNGVIASGASLMDWEWQPLPYSSEEWSALFDFGLGNGISISLDGYEERLYLELPDNYSLLKMDEELWIMHTGAHPGGEEYVWSVYLIEPLEERGSQAEETTSQTASQETSGPGMAIRWPIPQEAGAQELLRLTMD